MELEDYLSQLKSGIDDAFKQAADFSSSIQKKGMEEGKAVLLKEDYCDGLGNCLPVCPTGAITIERREAAAFDEEAVKQNMEKQKTKSQELCGCPGSMARSLKPIYGEEPLKGDKAADLKEGGELSSWPVQIRLVPVTAPYFRNADLLVAADCTAFAYADFHRRFIRGRITLIGCPKLDEGDYSEKLTEILKRNEIRSVTIIRMEVPCCGGLEAAVKTAVQNSGKFLPWHTVIISPDGRILSE